LKQVFFNFYNIKAQITSESDQILTLLKKDFSQFICEENVSSVNLSIRITSSKPPLEIVPQIISSMQTQNSICYDCDGLRYCDYYGEALVVLDTKKNAAQIYSENIERLHEITYLLILSRVGKLMDLMGLHKIHAFSVSYNDVAIVCMMPMKGGKSTLLMHFLKDRRFKLISDDIPLINTRGEVLPFPIKIGLSDIPPEFQIINPEENLYSMERRNFGKKELLCLKGIPQLVEPLEKKFKKVILIEAFRYNAKDSILKESSFLATAKGLLKHQVIGIGLPMVIEYFWENGYKDFLVKIRIFIMRVFAANSLLLRSRKLKLFLGKNPGKAYDVILEYLVDNHV
jgi:hypothetical protein